jgi:hypothetical protein
MFQPIQREIAYQPVEFSPGSIPTPPANLNT